MGRTAAKSATVAKANTKSPAKKLPTASKAKAKAKAVALVAAGAPPAAKAKAKRAIASPLAPAADGEKKRNFRGPREIIASKSAWQSAFKKLAKELGGRLSSDGNLIVEGAIKHWLIRLAPLLVSADKSKTITISSLKTAIFSQTVACGGNTAKVLEIFKAADAAVESYQKNKAAAKAANDTAAAE